MPKHLFNGYTSEQVPTLWPPRFRGKEIQRNGNTVMVVEESLEPFPLDLTADAFSIKSLADAGVPIQETGAGLIPATVEQRYVSAQRFGYDLNQKVQNERAEIEMKAQENKQNVQPPITE